MIIIEMIIELVIVVRIMEVVSIILGFFTGTTLFFAVFRFL